MSVIAYDDADDVIYSAPSWVNGQNGGFGFGAWQIPATSFTGGLYTLSDSNANGASPIGPGINGSNNMAWRLNGLTGTGAVERALPRVAIAGDFFCLECDPSVSLTQNLRLYTGPYNTTGGTFGVTVTPLPSGWQIQDATGTLLTGFAVDSGGYLLQFAFSSSTDYILTINRYSNLTSYTTTLRTMNEPVDYFSVQNGQNTVPTASLFINTLTYADSSGGYSGCAGDPHFVGFDGVRFDFHDHGRFLLWKSADMAVEVVFSMEDKGKDWPDWKDKTFISEIVVYNKGKKEVFTAYDKLDVLSEDSIPSGSKRGLVQDLEFVPGTLLGGRVIDFDAGKLVVTQFAEHGFGIQHLNASFILTQPFVKSQGIIGQTNYPAYMRQPNESFKIS